MKQIIILLTLLSANFAGYRGDTCSDEVLTDFASDLLDCEEDTIAAWRTQTTSDDLICSALKGYQKRLKKESNYIKGLCFTAGPCFLVCVGITMQGDDPDYVMSRGDKSVMTGAGIIAAISGIVWGTKLLVNHNRKSLEEVELMEHYETTKKLQQIRF